MNPSVDVSHLLRLSKRYAGARAISLSRLGGLAVANSTLFTRLESGRVTVRTLNRLVQYLSDHWPEGLAWPDDIPRPEAADRT